MFGRLIIIAFSLESLTSRNSLIHIALDVVMTKSFDMWYWNEKRFYKKLGRHFGRIEMYPITDWLPYPHVIYLCENVAELERVADGQALGNGSSVKFGVEV